MIGSTVTTSPRSASRRRSDDGPAFLDLGWLPFVLGTVLAFAAIGAVLLMLFGGTRYDDAVKNYLRISYTHESGLTDTLAPSYVWGHITAQTDVDQTEFADYLAKEAERYREHIVDEFGNDINISFDITKKDRLKGDELDAYRTKMAAQYKIPEDKLESACVLTVTVHLNGSEQSATYENVELTAVKVDGEYYIDQAFAYAVDIAEDAQQSALQQAAL